MTPCGREWVCNRLEGSECGDYLGLDARQPSPFIVFSRTCVTPCDLPLARVLYAWVMQEAKTLELDNTKTRQAEAVVDRGRIVQETLDKLTKACAKFDLDALNEVRAFADVAGGTIMSVAACVGGGGGAGDKGECWVHKGGAFVILSPITLHAWCARIERAS